MTRLTEDEAREQPFLRRGGWFFEMIPGVGDWSGPWKTKEAALAAMDGQYQDAHDIEAAHSGGRNE